MHKQMNIYIYIDTHTHTLTTDPSAFALVGGLCSFGVLFLVFKGFEFEVLYGVYGVWRFRAWVYILARCSYFVFRTRKHKCQNTCKGSKV